MEIYRPNYYVNDMPDEGEKAHAQMIKSLWAWLYFTGKLDILGAELMMIYWPNDMLE